MNTKEQKIKIAFVVFGIVIVFFAIGIWVSSKFLKSKPQMQLHKRTALSQEEFVEKVRYTLFLPSKKRNFLIPVQIEVAKFDSEAENIKTLLQKLMNMKAEDSYFSPFPENIKLLDIFITKSRVLVLNFSNEILMNKFSGSNDEIFTVFSIVNSIIYNFPDIKSVKFLVEGREIETLYGHIDMRFPLRFSSGWVKNN